MTEDKKMEKKKEVLKMAINQVQLTDTGVKHKYPSLVESSYKSEKDKVCYPSLYLTTKEAPDLKGAKAGDYITLVVEVCVKSHSLNDSMDNKDGEKESFSMDIEKLGVIKKK